MFQTNQKAQSGLEYLMTYGWALILLSTAILVLAPEQATTGNQINQKNLKLGNSVLPVFFFAEEKPASGFELTKKSDTVLLLSSGEKKAWISFYSFEEGKLKEMPKETSFSIDLTKLGETSYKWGYHFRLPNQGFTAAALVESESEITILDEQKGELLLDFTEISFADVLEFGFSVETKKIASNKVLVKMKKDYESEGIKAGEFVYIDPVATLVTEPVSIESTGNSLRPAIAVDDSNIYIAWTDSTNYAGAGTDADIFFKTRSRTGNWTDVLTQVVSTESSVTSDNSSIAVDDSNIYITWDDHTGGANRAISFKTKSKTGGLASNGIDWANATQTVSTESSVPSYEPVIAVDDTNIYIAWYDSGGYNNVFFKTRKKTEDWGTITEVVNKETEYEWENYPRYPTMVVDDTNIYIAWSDDKDYNGSGTDRDIFFRTRSKTGEWMDVPAQFVSTESTSSSWYPTIAVDDSNIYIAWRDPTDYGGAGTDVDVFFKTRSKTGGLTSNDVNWLNATEVVSTESTSSIGWAHPEIAVDDTNIYIAWEDPTDYDGAGTDADIFFKTKGKTDALGSNDINWASAAVVVSTESTGDSCYPDLNVCGGTVYITWQDATDFNGTGTDIVFRSFSPPTLPSVSITAPSTGYYSDTITVSATASDDSGVQDVNFYYTPSGESGFTGTLICSDDSSPYSCNWDSTAVADANYQIKAIVTASNGDKEQDFMSSPFGVDNSPPTTVDNDFNNTWQNTDANIQFSCSDGGVGCKNFYYSIIGDTNYQFAWETDQNIGIVFDTDGNYGVFYWSDDSLDQNAEAKLIYMAIDQTKPTLKATDFNNLWQNTDANILLSCEDVSGGCKNLYYGIEDDTNYQKRWSPDLNLGIELTTDGNWHVWYWADDNTTGVADNNTTPVHIYLAIDKTAPSTIDNDFNNTWQNTDANILLKCSDDDAGCKNLYYSLGDINYQKAWSQDQNIGIEITWDGNHEIFYWSDNNAIGVGDNNENAHLIYLAIDKSTPTTMATDYNNTWQNTDANILFSCSDVNGGCKNFYYSLGDINYQIVWNPDQNIGIELTTDANHEIFYWSDNNTTGAGDNNEATHLIYLAVDKTAPTAPTITSPATETTRSYTLAWSATTDATSGVSEYQTRQYLGTTTSNGLNTSYSFSIGASTSLPTTKTYCVIAVDNAGNTAETCKNVTFQAAATGSGWLGGRGFTGILGKETPIETKQILTLVNKFTPLAEASSPVLDQTEKQLELQHKRFATADDIRFGRGFKEQQLLRLGNVLGYRCEITVFIENVSDKTLTRVELVEEIPKEMVENAAFVGSDSNFFVIETDPLLKFLVGDIKSGGKAEITYWFERSKEQGPVTEEMFNRMKAPLVLIKLGEGDLCMGVYCNDLDACTRDYCEKGECRFVPMHEGAKCATDKACIEGKCVAVGEKEPETPLEKMAQYAVPITVAGIAVAVLIILLAAITITKRKKPGKENAKEMQKRG